MFDEAPHALVGVIEDDAGLRVSLGRLLHAGGFETALFDSAEAYIAAPPSRELLCLIVDVHLAGMSGIDLQRLLRREGFHVPIIITTGNRHEAIRERAHQEGCVAFFWKPVSADALLELLGSLARQSRH
jgi:FixJ family two-component response regulator